LLPAIQRLPGKIERAAVANDVASSLGVSKGLVLDQFRRQATDREQAPFRLPVAALPPNERLLLRCLLESERARNEVLPLWQERDRPATPSTQKIMDALCAIADRFEYDQLEARLDETERALLATLLFADGDNKEGEDGDAGQAELPAQALDCLRVMDDAARQAVTADLKLRIAAAEKLGDMQEALRLSSQLEYTDSGIRRRRRPIVE
jgi:hypothetical protein